MLIDSVKTIDDWISYSCKFLTVYAHISQTLAYFAGITGKFINNLGNKEFFPYIKNDSISIWKNKIHLTKNMDISQSFWQIPS